MLSTISQSSAQTCNFGKRVYRLNNAGTRKILKKVCRLESFQERWSIYFVLNIRDSFRKKEPFAYYKIYYKNALCLNRSNSRTVHTKDFLFSTCHTTPFQYVKLYFAVLHKLCANVMRSGVLFINCYFIRYGDIAVQSKCTFPA